MDRSENTRENAERSADLLRAAGIGRVVVVMHAFDVPRVWEVFGRVGLQVATAPTRLPKVDEAAAAVGDFLPSAPALIDSHLCCP